jgi:small redox-active disulfide protein 2
MEIKILGIGCARCKTLEKSVREAVADMNIQADVIKVNDIVEIINSGILKTPGLMVDGKVVSSGHLLSVSQVKGILSRTAGL